MLHIVSRTCNYFNKPLYTVTMQYLWLLQIYSTLYYRISDYFSLLSCFCDYINLPILYTVTSTCDYLNLMSHFSDYFNLLSQFCDYFNLPILYTVTSTCDSINLTLLYTVTFLWLLQLTYPLYCHQYPRLLHYCLSFLFVYHIKFWKTNKLAIVTVNNICCSKSNVSKSLDTTAK